MRVVEYTNPLTKDEPDFHCHERPQNTKIKERKMEDEGRWELQL